MAPADQLVLADDVGAVRTLTLNRPSRLNAFTADSYRLLAARLNEADGDERVHVVVLRGAGRAFCSGVDVELLGADERGERGSHRDEGGGLLEAFERLMDALTALTKPLIAAVHGPAVGIGATMLLHCDVVLVADGARLRFPFTSLRTAPEAGSSWLLPELVGPQRAAELLYTARWVEADEAVALGLAVRRCPPERLGDEAQALARTMAAQPPAAVAAAKRLLRAGRPDAVKAAVEREVGEARRLAHFLGPIAPA
jgi:enoyl-CoA hydratase/carnithine racemase